MSGYYDGLNQKLLAAIPGDAVRVLELGCANGRLGQRFKELHPDAEWVGVDISPEAAAIAAQHLDHVLTLDLDRFDPKQLGSGFDVVVIGDLLEHVREPERLLECLYDATTARARLVSCIPNMAHVSVLQRMVAGDVSYDDAGLLDRTHLHFFSRASVFKTFLDSGWLPHLKDQYRVEAEPGAFVAHLVAAAGVLGIGTETALRNLGLYQMIVVAEKCSMEALTRSTPMAPFSVIVPVNRPWQYELNVARSPGLREVGADVIPVAGAASAADAHARGSVQARHAWRLVVHQDVYFPVGSGFAIAQQLGALDAAGRHAWPVGFAGLAAVPGSGDKVRHAGLVVDRAVLFDHPSCDRAVSIDEFAVALHRDSRARIEPALGWHLWGTDLCLQALDAGDAAGVRIIRAPIFHNSTTGSTVPPEFRASAEALLTLHPRHATIPTLCGVLSRRDAAVAS